jgi:hypothetical protein
MNGAKFLEDVALDFVYATSTGEDMADPTADYWTVADIADHWGVTAQTIRTYRSRGRGELPEPDKVFGRSPVWKPATILNFERPGQGARTDLSSKEQTA